MAVRGYTQKLFTDTEAELLLLTPRAGDTGYAADTGLSYLYNGTAWRPSDAVRVLRGIANINGKTTGNTKIFTLPNTTFRFVPIGIHIEYVDMTGSVGLAPTTTIGTNATTYNNIATSSTLSTLLSSVGMISPSAFTIANNVTPLTANTDIYARVSVAATLFTTYTIRCDVFGYYEV